MVQFSKEDFRREVLAQRGVPQDLEFHIFSEVSSTNRVLWHQDFRDKRPRVAIALKQTAGRGQWGRVWHSQSGGLYLSVLVFSEFSPELGSMFTLGIGLGLAERLRDWGVPVRLKWPNDLLLAGRKLGGIKIETKNRGDRRHPWVIGVGLNWQNRPPVPGIALRAYLQQQNLDTIHTLSQLGAIAVGGIFQGLHSLHHWPRAQLIHTYQQYLHNIGQTVAVAGSEGQVIGVTEEGWLRVKLLGEGTRAIVAVPPGEVSLGYDD